MRDVTIIAFLSFLVLGTAAAKAAVGQQTALPLSVQKPPGPTDDFSLAHLKYQLRYRWQIAPVSGLFVDCPQADSRRTSVDDFQALFQDSWNNPIGG